MKRKQITKGHIPGRSVHRTAKVPDWSSHAEGGFLRAFSLWCSHRSVAVRTCSRKRLCAECQSSENLLTVAPIYERIPPSWSISEATSTSATGETPFNEKSVNAWKPAFWASALKTRINTSLRTNRAVIIKLLTAQTPNRWTWTDQRLCW